MIPGKERQRRWKKRQQAKGLKPVTLMLSKEAKAILDTENLKSGKTLSMIADRIIVDSKASNKKTSRELPRDDMAPPLSLVTTPDKASKKTPEQMELLNKISNLRKNRGKKT